MLETGKIAAEENTRRLVVEHGGFLYDADTIPMTIFSSGLRSKRNLLSESKWAVVPKTA